MYCVMKLMWGVRILQHTEKHTLAEADSLFMCHACAIVSFALEQVCLRITLLSLYRCCDFALEQVCLRISLVLSLYVRL